MSYDAERRIGHFIDTISDEIVEDIDAHGVDVIGEDEHGIWWGTERAAWMISHTYYTVDVWGHLHGKPWQGVFIGTVEEAVDYAERHGVVVEGYGSGEV